MMKIYGLFFLNIDPELVCLFQHKPTELDLSNVLCKWFEGADLEEVVSETLSGDSIEYRLSQVSVIENVGVAND